MSRRKNRRRQGEPPWEIDGVSEAARQAAEKAAADAGLTLDIWLREVILRASQEGVGDSDQPGAAPTAEERLS